MKAKSIILVCLLFFTHKAWALDVLDVFKFRRDTEVKLQTGRPQYDLTQSHGVVSPFTSYIGRMIAQLQSAKSLSQLPSLKVPPLKPGEIVVEYVYPQTKVAIADLVLRRNYIGVQEFFIVGGNVDEVFKLATDYNNLYRLFPGMEKSRIVDREANRVDVENWRKSEASVFGKRRSYYLTSNMLFSDGNLKKRIIKSQLLKGEGKKVKHQALLFMDSLWYFEDCGQNCTQVYCLSFYLLRWDYGRTPPFFPFVAKEVRKQIVTGVVEGAARSSLACLVKFGDTRLRGRPLSSFTPRDHEWVSREVEARLKKMRQDGHLKIPWDEIFA